MHFWDTYKIELKFIFLLLTFYTYFHNLTRLVRDHVYSKAFNIMKSGDTYMLIITNDDIRKRNNKYFSSNSNISLLSVGSASDSQNREPNTDG